jgi:hypothetical protein
MTVNVHEEECRNIVNRYDEESYGVNIYIYICVIYYLSIPNGTKPA